MQKIGLLASFQNGAVINNMYHSLDELLTLFHESIIKIGLISELGCYYLQSIKKYGQFLYGVITAAQF